MPLVDDDLNIVSLNDGHDDDYWRPAPPIIMLGMLVVSAIIWGICLAVLWAVLQFI